MWESPINVMEIQDSFVSEIKEKTEEMVFTEIKRIGIDVDKEELIKALMYDRNQYEKGRSDGYKNGIDELISQLEAEVESSAKFIREYDDSIAQKAYYKGLSDALKIAEQLKGEQLWI